MNHDAVDLIVEPGGRICYDATFNKSWGIRNPTTHTLKVLDRQGTSALVHPIRSKNVTPKYVYINLGYDYTDRSNFTTRDDIQDALVEKGDLNVMQGLIKIEDILEARRGLYIRDLDIVIGLSNAPLEFPDDTFTNVNVSVGGPSVFQYFINTDKVTKGKLVVMLNGVPTTLSTKHFDGLDNGLYVVENDGENATCTLVEADPIVGASVYELQQLLLDALEDKGSKDTKGIDSGLFNKHLDGINNRISVGLTRVDSEIEEGYKARDFIRKEYEGEAKTARALAVEESKFVNDSVKTTTGLLGTLAKFA